MVKGNDTPRKAEPPARLIDARIKEVGGWRGKTLSRVRALIKQADPGVVEEVKWRKPTNPAGVPVWSHDGIICTGESYKDSVRLTFAQGASLKDPKGLFNASLEGNALRAIVIHEGDELDEPAFTALVRTAVALNTSRRRQPRRTGPVTPSGQDDRRRHSAKDGHGPQRPPQGGA